MSDAFTLNAESRKNLGKGASRRLRRLAGQVPAVVYGGRKNPASISLEHKELVKQLENEAFYSHIIELNIDGKAESVILKDLQRHPARPDVLHADFMRVSKTKKMKTSVPLHFINEATSKGVKMQGGAVTHTMTTLEITCLPADLPEFIEVDLADVEVGQIVHISDLNLPKGVSSVELALGSDHDQPVATIAKPKGSASDDSEEEAGEE